METSTVVEKTSKQAKQYINQIATSTEKRLNSLESAIESMKKTMSSKSEVAKKKAALKKDQAEAAITTSPFKAVAYAAVVGAAIGFFASRRNKK